MSQLSTDARHHALSLRLALYPPGLVARPSQLVG